MRVLVMFDLPVDTPQERSDYARFRKKLINDGFIMMQQSVYCKLVMSATAANLAIQRVDHIKPPRGTIQALTITEKQYSQMEYLLGESQNEVLDTTERLVIF